MKTRLLFGSLAVALCAACGAPGEDNPSASRRFFSLGTAPPGGAFFVVGGAITEVLNQSAGDSVWEFTAEATKGSQENIRRLTSRQLDFALSNSSITYFAVRGEGSWDAKQPIQAVMTLAPNVALFITPKSSSVERMADLRGRRVVIGPEGAGFETFVRLILQAHGLTFDDLTPLYRTQAGAVDMLADGSAAAAFLGGAIPTASIAQASASQDIHFVPFDEAARKQLIEQYPFFKAANIPAGTYRGQAEDYQGLDVGSMHLITFEGQDEDLVYRFTRTLYEERAKVVERHPAGKAINPANTARSTGTAFHPGAVRYYREIGIWPDDDSGDQPGGSPDGGR